MRVGNMQMKSVKSCHQFLGKASGKLEHRFGINGLCCKDSGDCPRVKKTFLLPYGERNLLHSLWRRVLG